MGLLLRTKRHTATGKRSQVLVAAVNHHMPATPAWGNQLRIKDANEVTVLMRQRTRRYIPNEAPPQTDEVYQLARVV